MAMIVKHSLLTSRGWGGGSFPGQTMLNFFAAVVMQPYLKLLCLLVITSSIILSLLCEGAVASTAVKLKLRECLLNKSQRELSNISNSPPELRQWLVFVARL